MASPNLHDLIVANHILHHHSVADAYGHISLRNPSNPATFFLSHSVAPALVSCASDIIEYRIEDASPVDPQAGNGYKERFIHSEVMKRYPSVNSVVHSHAESVVVYGIAGVEMKPCFHMAGFLGNHVPIFDIANHYPRHATRDLLVSTAPLGAALAVHFSHSASYASRGLAAGASIISSFTSPESTSTPELQPDHTVVLMRGHGFTTIGSSVKEAVFRAIYTQQNANMQSTALMVRNAALNATFIAKATKEEGKGKVVDEGPQYLNEQELSGCRQQGEKTIERPWGLWVREVEKSGLYELK